MVKGGEKGGGIIILFYFEGKGGFENREDNKENIGEKFISS